MDQILASENEKNEIDKYLSSGSQTQITPEIEEVASEIKGTVLEKVQKILEIGPTLVEMKDFDYEVFRKRTGAQRIQDKYITGCTDAALVFIVLARASGIPTKYVETIGVEWLKKGGSPIVGHVYAQVYDELQDKWFWVDPMRRRVGNPPREEVIFGEGLDSWDLGIKGHNTLRGEFEIFRNQWLLKSTASKPQPSNREV